MQFCLHTYGCYYLYLNTINPCGVLLWIKTPSTKRPSSFVQATSVKLEFSLRTFLKFVQYSNGTYNTQCGTYLQTLASHLTSVVDLCWPFFMWVLIPFFLLIWQATSLEVVIAWKVCSSVSCRTIFLSWIIKEFCSSSSERVSRSFDFSMEQITKLNLGNMDCRIFSTMVTSASLSP